MLMPHEKDDDLKIEAVFLSSLHHQSPSMRL